MASCSSGVELDQAQVVVVGNTKGIGGRYRIGHSVMRDALDADGIWAAIKDAGLDLPERPHTSDLQGRLVNVFLKCEVSQDGNVRGRRNAMLDDSDVHWHRQIKSAVGGVTAAVTGDPAVFVSVSAAHQGPTAAVPWRRSSTSGPGEPTGYRAPTRRAANPPLQEPLLAKVPAWWTGCNLSVIQCPLLAKVARGGSVGEVAGAGEVHRHAGGLGRSDDLLVAHRPTGSDDGAHPGVEQHLQPVGEREERVRRGHRSARPVGASALARDTARWQESTRLT